MKRFLLVLLLALPLAATAQDYPDYTSTRVNDFANLIDAETEARIDGKLAALASEKGVELTVVTIDRRSDYGDSASIEAFATGLFNHWGVGNAQRNDGIMILVAAGDREMRLELGSGYPSTYDWLAEDVVDGAILPAFRDGRMAEGIEAGVDETITRIADPFAAGREPEAPPEPRPVASGEGGGGGGFGLAGFGFFGLIAAAIGALILRGPVSAMMFRRKPCPKCGQPGMDREIVTLQQPTRYSNGQRQTTITCPRCGYHNVALATIPMITDNDSSSSSGSGGSFGGGSSSGGGATGKW